MLPTPAEYAAKLKEWESKSTSQAAASVHSKDQASAHAQDLIDNFPPRGIQYWESQSQKVEPGMHAWALDRHLPAVNASISLMFQGRDTQVLVYAVDSELAAICEVTTTWTTDVGPNSLVRVVEFHGFAKHNLACDKWGSLIVKEMSFGNHDKVSIVFANDAG